MYQHNTNYINAINILTDGGCVQSVGTGNDSRTGEVRDGEREGQGQENWAAAYHQGGHPLKLPEALRYLHGGQDECVGAGAGVRAVKTDGIQVYEDDGIKRAPAMVSRRGMHHLSKKSIVLSVMSQQMISRPRYSTFSM